MAAFATDGAGVDGNSCSIRVTRGADNSVGIGVVAMIVFGCSAASRCTGKISWVTDVVSVVEGICGETPGCGCAVGVGGGAAVAGLASLDSSTV